ncbi:MAG: phosphate ABC transporter permease PstA [Thermoguttaceae bacterium]
MTKEKPPRQVFGRASLPFVLAHGERGRFWRRGEPQVWASAAALAGMLLLAFTLLAVIVVNGLGVFWPSSVSEITLAGGDTLLGMEIRRETNPDDGQVGIQLKTGNRERDPQRQDFRWIRQDAVVARSDPADVFVLERLENGDFFGRFQGVRGPDLTTTSDRSLQAFSDALRTIRKKSDHELAPVARQLFTLSNELQVNRDRLLRLKYRQSKQGSSKTLDREQSNLETEERRIKEQSDRLVERQQRMSAGLRRNVAVMTDASGKESLVPLLDVVRCYRPNAMGLGAKCLHYLQKVGELLWDSPRESNTEGGLFPAIFGTVMLIVVMAAACFPLGVLAGVYLGEYAKDGFLVRLVRIAVNNLAGIPSIVYGIFGLGFFVYGIGGFLDQWMFPERAAVGTPTFGTGGILWASLTLGLLTVPIVIVSTEEALRAIPRATREGSFALGATKFQTLVRVLIPLASPGMMTGFILAMARAAGEVAPLMITGVVKLAPQLPLDGVFPYFHLERKFMHLGFHIFDVGFQSPNVEASKPMVFVTTLLLLTIVLAMTSVAICLRNRMRSRYHTRTI